MSSKKAEVTVTLTILMDERERNVQGGASEKYCATETTHSRACDVISISRGATEGLRVYVW